MGARWCVGCKCITAAICPKLIALFSRALQPRTMPRERSSSRNAHVRLRSRRETERKRQRRSKSKAPSSSSSSAFDKRGSSRNHHNSRRQSSSHKRRSSRRHRSNDRKYRSGHTHRSGRHQRSSCRKTFAELEKNMRKSVEEATQSVKQRCAAKIAELEQGAEARLMYGNLSLNLIVKGLNRECCRNKPFREPPPAATAFSKLGGG